MFELAICTVGAAISLIAEHIGLWRLPWRLSRPASYVVGTATIACWWSVWCLRIDQPLFAVAFWVLLIGAGSPVVLAYWLRGVLAKHDEAAYTAGKHSRVPLTQEKSDRGV